MKIPCSALLLALLFFAALPVHAQELPADARAIVDEYQKAANAIRDRAEAEIAVLRSKATPRLRVLQDKYCKEARLDDALAIRDVVRQLSNIQPDPGNVHASTGDIGHSQLFEVVGSTTGAIWGDEAYTSDSSLAAAVVHAGVLKAGEKGIVRVRFLAGQKSYRAATRNGVTSEAYGPWTVSFTVERVKAEAGD